MKKILIVTDHEDLLKRFKSLLYEIKLENNILYKFEYSYSFDNKHFTKKYKNSDWIKPIKIKDSVQFLSNEYDIIISLHCKQIFPKELIDAVRCINIHPGYNPYNRGYFPQVFSIINSLPCGVTIHEMDEKIDNGPIICQKEIKIDMWDTSLSVYNKIIDLEMNLLNKNLKKIIDCEYKTFTKKGGNINYKNDFNKLCEINVNDTDTFINHINKLRALSHGDHQNAHFIDEMGNKIYVKIQLFKS